MPRHAFCARTFASRNLARILVAFSLKNRRFFSHLISRELDAKRGYLYSYFYAQVTHRLNSAARLPFAMSHSLIQPGRPTGSPRSWTFPLAPGILSRSSGHRVCFVVVVVVVVIVVIFIQNKFRLRQKYAHLTNRAVLWPTGRHYCKQALIFLNNKICICTRKSNEIVQRNQAAINELNSETGRHWPSSLRPSPLTQSNRTCWARTDPLSGLFKNNFDGINSLFFGYFNSRFNKISKN